MLPNDVAMMAEADGGMAAGRRVRRRLRPRRRAVDRAAMRTNGNCVGKLALCRKVAGDVLVVGVVDASGEVLDGHDFMFVWTGQKGLCERDHIQPLVPRETKQPVVQVESVDINNSLFLHLFKRQGLDSRPALHRIAEAQRSVSNPSRGSVDIVPNISACRKGAEFANWRIEARKAG